MSHTKGPSLDDDPTNAFSAIGDDLTNAFPAIDDDFRSLYYNPIDQSVRPSPTINSEGLMKPSYYTGVLGDVSQDLDYELKSFESNPFESNPFVSNPLESNSLSSNSFESNPFVSNPLESNSLSSNSFESNPLVDRSEDSRDSKHSGYELAHSFKELGYGRPYSGSVDRSNYYSAGFGRLHESSDIGLVGTPDFLLGCSSIGSASSVRAVQGKETQTTNK